MCYILPKSWEVGGIAREVIQAWLSEVDKLSGAQKIEVGEILAGHPAGPIRQL